MVKNGGKHKLNIIRTQPDAKTTTMVSAILLTTKTDFRLPERQVTAKGLWRSFNMKNSLAFYEFPYTLLCSVSDKALQFRMVDNIDPTVTFRAEGRDAGPAKPWELYSFEEFPEMFDDDPELKKKVQEGVSRNLAALREKALEIRKTTRYTLANMNLLHVPFWAQEKFLRLYQDADPKWFIKKFYERPPHLCALSPEAEKLTVGMVDELFANVPLDGLMLTIGDNRGYWQCTNPEHQHHKDWIKRQADTAVSRKDKPHDWSKAVDAFGDTVYAEQAFVNIIRWVYTGMKKHHSKPMLLLRCWGGPGYFLVDDSRRKEFLARIYEFVPKEDFYLVSKHSTPPSMDYCWKPAEYAPIFQKALSNTFAITGWGENARGKSLFPITIWYDWPDIIQRDIKFLVEHGLKGALWGRYRNSQSEQELSYLALGCLRRDPYLDLDMLKQRWAEFRFGKEAGVHVLAAIEYGPKILEKHTLYHEGREQMASLHYLSSNGKTRYGIPRAVPAWLKSVNSQNYDKLKERLDATAEATAMLREIKAAQKLRPDDEMIEYYVAKAEATVYLANWFRDFHQAYLHRMMYLNLKENDREAAWRHVREGMKLYDSALAELERYIEGPPYGMLPLYYLNMSGDTKAWAKKMRQIADRENLLER